MECTDPKLGRDIFNAELIEDATRRGEVFGHRKECAYCKSGWEEYLEQIRGVRHEFHPTADELYDFANAEEKGLPQQHGQRTRFHLGVCGECREVYILVRESLRADDPAPVSHSEARPSNNPTHNEIVLFGFRLRGSTLRPVAALGAVAIIFLLGIWTVREMWRPKPIIYRGSTEITLVQPADEAEVRTYQGFRWQGDPLIGSYQLTITDASDGGVVFVQTVSGSDYILDAAAAARFKNGRSYEWTVTASIPGSTSSISSRKGRFTYVIDTQPSSYRDHDEKRRKAMLDTALNGTEQQTARLIAETAKYLHDRDSAAPADRAWANYVRGISLYNSDQAANAAENLLNALVIWDQNGRPDAAVYPVHLYSRALINYALASEDSGDPSTAVENYERALLTLAGTSDPEGLAATSTCLLNLGTLYRNVGLPEQAKDAYDRAFKIDQQLSNKDSMADDLTNIGNIMVDELDDPEQGLRILEQAREIRFAVARENGGRFARNAADTLDALGAAYQAAGRFDDALASYEQTAEIDTQYGSPGGKVPTIINRGELFLVGMNNLDLASVEFKNAIRELEGRTDADPEDIWRAYDGLGRTELRAGDIRSAELHFLKALDVTSRIKKNFGDKQMGRTFNASHSLPAYSLALLYRTMGDTRRFIDIVERTKASALRKDGTADRTPESVDIDGLRSQLPDGSAALIYLTGSRTDQILLLALTKDSATWYDLPPPKQVNPAIRGFVLSLSSGALDSGPDVAAAALSNTLIPDPLIRSFSEAKITRLLISPDGELFNAPFDALPISGEASNELLIRHFEVSMVPSFSWLRELQAGITAPNHLNADALIIANPSVDQQNCRPSGIQADTLPQIGEWRDLSGTVDEAKAVLEYASPESHLLSGESATSSNFRAEDLQQFQIIHFATHAFLGRTSQTSSLLFGCPSNPDMITGDEVTNLHLSNQLVILSACETAVGKGLATEGNDSLAWGFLTAGAATSVASRWNIEDRAAAEFVNLFYENLSKGMTVDAALRIAKLTEIDDLRRPVREWASFTSIGYGDLTVALRPSSSQTSGTITRLWPVAILILVLAGTLILQYLGRRA